MDFLTQKDTTTLLYSSSVALSHDIGHHPKLTTEIFHKYFLLPSIIIRYFDTLRDLVFCISLEPRKVEWYLTVSARIIT